MNQKIDGRSKEAREEKAKKQFYIARSAKARAAKAAKREARNAVEEEAKFAAERAQTLNTAFTNPYVKDVKVIKGLLGQYRVMETSPVEAKASAVQIGGTHYKDLGVEPWDAMEAWLTPEEFRGFLRGCAVKYLARANLKDGFVNYQKAHHCLTKLIELGDL